MNKTDMRAVDVNSNLKNWPAWDYKDYRLNEKEAKPCTDALDNYIWHSVEKQGMPTEDGWIILKYQHEDSITYEAVLYSDEFREECQDIAAPALGIVAWRKIIDNENAYMEET